MRRIHSVILLLVAISMVFYACGGGEKETASSAGAASKIVAKDTSTPAEQGGYGFDNLADWDMSPT